MQIQTALWLNLLIALGIGLLIGAERERSKGTGPYRASGGIRTFTFASIIGAVSMLFNQWVFIAAIACVLVFAAIAYFNQRSADPGITTEIALIITVMLGAIAMSQPALSAAIAVAVAILLAAKEPIHGFVREQLTKSELHDLLVLAAATLIILPLVPNDFIGPFHAINPHHLWLIVILVMTISALGNLVLRWFGARIGLPVVGFISGFISSVATITVMGQRAKESPELLAETVAAATLSSLATILQLLIYLAVIHPPTLLVMALPLALGGVSILIYGVVMAIKLHDKHPLTTSKPSNTFSVKSALILATIIAVVLMISSALKAWFGQSGVVAASGIAGLADVHAPTIAVATMAATNQLSLMNSVIPILAALTANSIAKAVVAVMSGSRVFAQQVILGLSIQVSAVWLGWWLL
jgi:uncharacterized membrane protein (DUF4010 family)